MKNINKCEKKEKIIQNFNLEDLKYYNVFLLDQC